MAPNLIRTPISIYALGGLGEVGKNTYCIESEKSISQVKENGREKIIPG